MDRRPANRTSRIRIDRNFSGAHAVPDRNDTERDRPVSRILPDGGIAVIHQLVAVVFELLAKVIEHRPGFVTGGTAETVFTGECRQGVGPLPGTENKKDQNQRCDQEMLHPLRGPKKARLHSSTHAESLRRSVLKGASHKCQGRSYKDP